MTATLTRSLCLASTLWLGSCAGANERPQLGNAEAVGLTLVCGGCHGTSPSTNTAMAVLSTLDHKTFVKKFDHYRQDTKSSTAMSRIAKGYTDQEVQVLAQFFTSTHPSVCKDCDNEK